MGYSLAADAWRRDYLARLVSGSLSTHAILVQAIHPAHVPDVANYSPDDVVVIHPPNHVVEFKAEHDAAAALLTQRSVQAVVEGELLPDSVWSLVWAKAVKHAAEHLLGGAHPVQ